MTRLEIRNLSPDLLKGYLIDEFGGRQQPDGSVAGDGWEARFIAGEPARFKRFAVPVLFVEFQGSREAAAASFLASKAMRGGG